jgi:hypothetical protein
MIRGYLRNIDVDKAVLPLGFYNTVINCVHQRCLTYLRYLR